MKLLKGDLVRVDGGTAIVELISDNGASVLLRDVRNVTPGRIFAVHPDLGRVLLLMREGDERSSDYVDVLNAGVHVQLVLASNVC